jgi:glutaredoxin 3
MKQVKIYSTPTCHFCMQTKEFLKKNKIKYTDINVAENDKAREKMVEKSGQMGVPVIEIGDELIIGFEPEKIMKALK